MIGTLVLVGLSARSAAAQGVALSSPPEEQSPSTAPPAAAIPRWVVPESPPAPAQETSEEPKRMSPRSAKRLETAGIVLTLIGVIGTVTGTVMSTTADNSGDFGGFAVLPGIFVIGASSGFLGSGIPLWIVGARNAPQPMTTYASAGRPADSTPRGLWISGSF